MVVEGGGGSVASEIILLLSVALEIILLLLRIILILSFARREWGEPAVTSDQESVVVETDAPGGAAVEGELVEDVGSGGSAGGGGGAGDGAGAALSMGGPAERPRRR